jgi:hypothetical protein
MNLNNFVDKFGFSLNNDWSGFGAMAVCYPIKTSVELEAPRNEMFIYFTIVLIGKILLGFETPNVWYWVRTWLWNTKLWWLFITTNNYSNFWDMFCDQTFYFCEHEVFSDVF